MKQKTGFLLITCLILISVSLPQAQDAQVCKVCGASISGEYFETRGCFYHPSCFTCEYCKQPIGDTYIVYRHRNYHASCFEKHVALRCAVCGEIVTGKYLLDYWGNASHPWHEGKIPRCDFCQRFIVGALVDRMIRHPDGRFLCGKCSPSVITSLKEARSLMFEVAAAFEKFGLEVNPQEVELHLVGREELRERSSGRSYDTTGFADCFVEKNLFGRVREQSIDVYLLHSMPRVQMIGTLAHELTHVWQFLHGQSKQGKALSEGSCNFSSYLVLRKIGGEEAEFIIHNMLNDEDPVYGEGFRRVKGYAEKEGLVGWLQLMKNPELASF